MTLELATIIAAIVGVAIVVALALAWWINRPPPATAPNSGALPLFGSDIAPPGQAWEGDVRETSVASQMRQAASLTPAEALANEPPGFAGSARATRSRTQTSTPTTVRPVLPRPPESSALARDRVSTERDQAVEAARAELASPTVQSAMPTSRQEPAEGIDRFAPPVTPVSTPEVPPSSAVVSNGVPGVMIEGHLLRFSVPAEGTLQFLPGRLEIATGPDRGREFRFVHVPGPNGTEVTFGRSEGELYRHIQLRNQTVSRSHARMRLDSGNWLLLNLSNTNPVVHNGRVLGNGEEQPLTDGDRIEMGEVFFTFRSR